MIVFTTADLYDRYENKLQIATPIFNHYGGKVKIFGPAATLKVFEDNSLIRDMLEEPGHGRVLVVDGGASLKCALLGDMLAQLAKNNDWGGVVIYGCIRDSAIIANIDLGIKALNTNPRKSIKKGIGKRDIAVNFADITIHPDDYIYADQDGLMVSPEKLELN